MKYLVSGNQQCPESIEELQRVEVAAATVRGTPGVLYAKVDYHDEMTGDVFFEWLFTKLLPNLSANSVIVIDNGYPSVRPTNKNYKLWMEKRRN